MNIKLKNNQPLRGILLLLLGLSLITSCKDETPVKPTPITDGISFSPVAPDADGELTITFKAASTSALYGYIGDVYAHIGVVTEGTWYFVPAGWSQNIEKCKMTPDGLNVWKLKLTPSIRAWFGSGETAVTKVGVVIRSADGAKKGVADDTFVTVTDTKYKGFEPVAIKMAALPVGVKEGINVINSTTVTLVLADKDKNGSHKDFAHVVGDFNNWTLSNTEQSQLFRDDAAGCWWITISNLDATKEYAFQYYVGTTAGEVIRLTDAYSTKILDPDNDKYIPTSTYNSQNLGYPTGARGLVSTFKIQPDTYNWEVTNFTVTKPENLVIYELLLRDFTPEKSLNAAITKLDYLKTLGINAVELMPVQEFDGNNSWGYNPSHYFATDKAYGDPATYKKFIDECHKRGIAVIVDVVFNHATGANPFAKLYWNSTTNKTAANNPWFNVDAPHPYSVFHDFNHEFTGTRTFFKRVIKYWLEEYKIDGYRLDLTKGLSQRAVSESTASSYDQSRIDILTDYYNAAKEAKSNVVFILEHFCDNSEETALANKGMYLWRNVNNAFSQSAMGYASDSGFDGLNSNPRKWVGFAESHDEERNFYKAKMYGDGNIITDSITRIKRVPLNIAFTTLVPGPKMLWQFEEIGYDNSINSFGGRTNEKPSAWGWLSLAHRKAAYDAAAKIISLRSAYGTAFSEGNFQFKMSATDWNAGRTIILTHADISMVVVANFSAINSIKSSPGFPSIGKWYNLLSGEVIDVSNKTMEFTLLPGELLIYTTVQITPPANITIKDNTTFNRTKVAYKASR